MPYDMFHTALSHGATIKAEPCQRFEYLSHGGTASVGVVVDLMSGQLPADFAPCDVYYGELPWEKGFQIFNERAGVTEPRTWRDLMLAVGAIIQQVQAPVILPVGKKAAKILPKPDAQWEIVQHNQTAKWNAQCLVYHSDSNWSFSTARSTDELILHLAAQFACLGHLACGYGNAAVAFHRAGKRFVACDFNAHCIGVLKRRLEP